MFTTVLFKIAEKEEEPVAFEDYINFAFTQRNTINNEYEQTNAPHSISNLILSERSQTAEYMLIIPICIFPKQPKLIWKSRKCFPFVLGDDWKGA